MQLESLSARLHNEGGQPLQTILIAKNKEPALASTPPWATVRKQADLPC